MIHTTQPAMCAIIRIAHLDSEPLRDAIALIPKRLFSHVLCISIDRLGQGVRRRASEPGPPSALLVDGVVGIPFASLFGGIVTTVSHCFVHVDHDTQTESASSKTWGEAYLGPAMLEAAKLTLLADVTQAQHVRLTGDSPDGNLRVSSLEGHNPDDAGQTEGALIVLTRMLTLELALTLANNSAAAAGATGDAVVVPVKTSGRRNGKRQEGAEGVPQITTSDLQVLNALRDCSDEFPQAVEVMCLLLRLAVAKGVSSPAASVPCLLSALLCVTRQLAKSVCKHRSPAQRSFLAGKQKATQIQTGQAECVRDLMYLLMPQLQASLRTGVCVLG